MRLSYITSAIALAYFISVSCFAVESQIQSALELKKSALEKMNLAKDLTLDQKLKKSILLLDIADLTNKMGDKSYKQYSSSAITLLNDLIFKNPESLELRVLRSEGYLNLSDISLARQDISYYLNKKNELNAESLQMLSLWLDNASEPSHYTVFLGWAKAYQNPSFKRKNQVLRHLKTRAYIGLKDFQGALASWVSEIQGYGAGLSANTVVFEQGNEIFNLPIAALNEEQILDNVRQFISSTEKSQISVQDQRVFYDIANQLITQESANAEKVLSLFIGELSSRAFLSPTVSFYLAHIQFSHHLNTHNLAQIEASYKNFDKSLGRISAPDKKIFGKIQDILTALSGAKWIASRNQWGIEILNQMLKVEQLTPSQRTNLFYSKAVLHRALGEFEKAILVLTSSSEAEKSKEWLAEQVYSGYSTLKLKPENLQLVAQWIEWVHQAERSQVFLPEQISNFLVYASQLLINSDPELGAQEMIRVALRYTDHPSAMSNLKLGLETICDSKGEMVFCFRGLGYVYNQSQSKSSVPLKMLDLADQVVLELTEKLFREKSFLPLLDFANRSSKIKLNEKICASITLAKIYALIELKKFQDARVELKSNWNASLPKTILNQLPALEIRVGLAVQDLSMISKGLQRVDVSDLSAGNLALMLRGAWLIQDGKMILSLSKHKKCKDLELACKTYLLYGEMAGITKLESRAVASSYRKSLTMVVEIFEEIKSETLEISLPVYSSLSSILNNSLLDLQSEIKKSGRVQLMKPSSIEVPIQVLKKYEKIYDDVTEWPDSFRLQFVNALRDQYLDLAKVIQTSIPTGISASDRKEALALVLAISEPLKNRADELQKDAKKYQNYQIDSKFWSQWNARVKAFPVNTDFSNLAFIGMQADVSEDTAVRKTARVVGRSLAGLNLVESVTISDLRTTAASDRILEVCVKLKWECRSLRGANGKNP